VTKTEWLNLELRKSGTEKLLIKYGKLESGTCLLSSFLYFKLLFGPFLIS